MWATRAHQSRSQDLVFASVPAVGARYEPRWRAATVARRCWRCRTVSVPACGTPNTGGKLHPRFGPVPDEPPGPPKRPSAPPTDKPFCPRCWAEVRLLDPYCARCGMDLEGVREEAALAGYLGVWTTPGPTSTRGYQPQRSLTSGPPGSAGGGRAARAHGLGDCGDVARPLRPAVLGFPARTGAMTPLGGHPAVDDDRRRGRVGGLLLDLGHSQLSEPAGARCAIAAHEHEAGDGRLVHPVREPRPFEGGRRRPLEGQ